MSGWIKLHRKITGSGIFTDPDLLRLWVLCLTKASHKETSVVIDRQQVELLPGEFVTGRKSLTAEYNEGLKPRFRKKELSIWRDLKFLEECGNVNIKATNKYSVISISKWCDYQESEQQMNNNRTTDEQQVNTNKNVKKEKNDKKVIKEHSQNTVALTNHLIDLLKINNPNVKVPASLDKWNDEMDKLERIDKYDFMQIRSVIDWCQKDPFWKGNILSVPKLREKIGTLMMQMQRPKGNFSSNAKVSSFERLQQLAREEDERAASGNY